MLTRTAKTLVLIPALALLLPALPAWGAETAETVLIRQALEKDRSGMRRGDAELVASAMAENFVHYDARGSVDPAGWTIPHEDLASYAGDLETDLQARRYDISRTVTFLHVYKQKALVTTVDSGWVQDRATEERQPYARTSLWTFRKLDEEWLATGLVSALGDSASGPAPAGSAAPEALSSFLMGEAADWTDGDAGGVLDHFDEEFVGYDSYTSSNPAKLVVIFGNAEEFEEWLRERLSLVDYTVERSVVSAKLGAGGTEAIAITDETVSVAHRQGTATSERQRRVVWTLSRRSGAWKVTNMFLHMKDWK